MNDIQLTFSNNPVLTKSIFTESFTHIPNKNKTVLHITASAIKKNDKKTTITTN